MIVDSMERLANEIRMLRSTIHPVYRLTHQLCKDMVIVFAHRIQSKYLLTKQKMLNALFVWNKLHHSQFKMKKCEKEQESVEQAIGREREVDANNGTLCTKSLIIFIHISRSICLLKSLGVSDKRLHVFLAFSLCTKELCSIHVWSILRKAICVCNVVIANMKKIFC